MNYKNRTEINGSERSATRTVISGGHLIYDCDTDVITYRNAVSRTEHIPAEKYPRIIERVGESPPQYVDFDRQ